MSDDSLKIHKAQKDHKCFVCGRKIPKGHKYWRDYEEGGDDGALKDIKEHTNCELYNQQEILR
jgi:DNA repair exonuclease SbcCD ATPase subunit